MVFYDCMVSPPASTIAQTRKRDRLCDAAPGLLSCHPTLNSAATRIACYLRRLIQEIHDKIFRIETRTGGLPALMPTPSPTK